MADLDQDEEQSLELSFLWQLIHPEYAHNGSEEAEEENEDDEEDEELRQKRRAPKLSKVLRYLNDIEDDEELERMLQERDPVTRQTLLQWAARQRHFILVEYLIKRAQRMAFGFPMESTEMAVFLKWEEMKPELPSPAEVQARQQRRDAKRAERMAARLQQMLNPPDDEEEEEPEEDEDDEDEADPLPEEMVHEALGEYHDEWEERGVGTVKKIGELGVYIGARLRDGTKQGLGMALYPNGDAYAGEYMDNMRHGEGVYWWSQQGILYVGTWARGVRHGLSGRIVYPDGSKYLGGWRADTKHGTGRYTYADGSSYDGDWVHNKKHGYGVYRHTDGSVFHGSFVDNAFTAGEWRLASGTTRYIGNFVKDIPDGAGIFVHRLGTGLRTDAGVVAPPIFQPLGAYQQEGRYGPGGRWHPGTLHGTTRVPPRLDILAPNNPEEALKRIPLTFAPECAGGVLADLVKAANFPPLCRWLQRLLPLNEDKTNGVLVKSIEVCSFVYSREDGARLVELRVRPVLFNATGQRLRMSNTCVDTILLKERTTRLMLVIERAGRNTEEGRAPMVVLECRLQMPSADPSHMQYRLPIVHLSHDGVIEGDFARNISPALRVSLSRATTKQLLRPLHSDLLIGDAEEDVLMYVQQWDGDAHRMLNEKLLLASAAHKITLPENLSDEAKATAKEEKTKKQENGNGNGKVEATDATKATVTGFVACEYVSVPLSRVPSVSTDGITIIAAATALRRRRLSQLPAATVSPQRSPTPIPPPPEPRPELQPLYDARKAMKLAEEEEREDEDAL